MDGRPPSGITGSLPARKPSAPRLLTDAPLTDPASDAFGHHVFARALAGLIDSESTATPLTVSISAPWGAGKTSMARMLERELETASALRHGNRPNIVCWFNAWAHSDAPHLGAALAATVARTVDRRRPLWRRVLQPLPTAMLSPTDRARRRASLALGSLLVAAVVALLLTSGDRPVAALPLDRLSEQLLGVGSLGAAIAVGALVWRRVWAIAQHAAQFVDDPRSEAAKGTMDQVAAQIGSLIRQARRDGRVVIFVDDLERCQPRHAMEVCEVASQLLAHEGVVTVLVADMAVIAASAEHKYEDPEAGGARGAWHEHSLGRRYLEKLVQIEVALPAPHAQDMRGLLAQRLPAAREAAREELASPRPPDSTPRASGVLRERVGAVAGSARLWLWVAAVGFVVFVVEAVRAPAETAEVGTVGTLAFCLWFVGLLAAAWAKGLELLRRRRARRAERAIGDRIDEASLRRVDQSALRDEVARTTGQGDKELARHMVEVRLLDEAQELQGVEEVILRYPPALPRAAKRMLNHARILTWIARERGLFDGDPPMLSPAQLGEWIVLCERWPEVAARIAQEPDLLPELEAAAPERAELEAVLARLELEVPVTPHLRDLLLAEPRLGRVAPQLVHLDAKGPPPPAAGARPAAPELRVAQPAGRFAR